MKLFVMSGSTSSKSINSKLAAYAASLIPNATLQWVLLSDYDLPIYSEDLHGKNGIPEPVYQFSDLIHASDALLISLAEHNGSYTAAFKNILDWTSVIEDRKTFGNKPMFLTATSNGVRGAIDVLQAAERRFPYLGADLKGSFSLPQFDKNFQEGKGIINEALDQQLKERIKKLYELF
jgi:NAD(P)H-dependent FMN reductase